MFSILLLFFLLYSGQLLSIEKGINFFERGEFKKASTEIKNFRAQDDCTLQRAKLYNLAMSNRKFSKLADNELKIELIMRYLSPEKLGERNFYTSLLGRMFLEGVIKEPNERQGLNMIKSVCEQYDYASYLLGLYYSRKIGNLLHHMPILAKIYYKKAETKSYRAAKKKLAEMNFILQMNSEQNIAMHFLDIIKKPRNKSITKKYRSLLKKNNSNELELAFFILYLVESPSLADQNEGKQICSDEFKEALLDIMQADEYKACPYFNYIIGRFAQIGLINIADKVQILNYLEKATINNYPPALYALAVYKKEHFPGFSDYLILLKKSAEMNFPKALCFLARIYENDPQNKDKSYKLYKKASNLGDVQAMHKMARYNLYINFPKSVSFYKKAIAYGDLEAAYLLATLYENNKNKETKRKAVIVRRQLFCPVRDNYLVRFC